MRLIYRCKFTGFCMKIGERDNNHSALCSKMLNILPTSYWVAPSKLADDAQCYANQHVVPVDKFAWEYAILMAMRRYSLYITLLVSLLLPLHAAASALLSAPTCPAKATMAISTADNAAPDCCDEDGKMDCQQIQTCHGCNLGGQVFSFATPTFTLTSDTRSYLGVTMPFVASSDPASVWRPPTNS